MAYPTVSPEKAAVNALASHLATGLGSDVQVWSYWPDANVQITNPHAAAGQPRSTVTILLAGKRQDEMLTPYKSGELLIHDAMTARVTTVTATDTTTGVARLNAAVASYEAHRVDVTAHASADTTNIVTAPTATDLDTGIVLVNDFMDQLAPHIIAAAHANPDGSTALAALAPVATGNAAGFVAAVNTLTNALNAHYAARIDQWTAATCKQQIQIDLWTAFDTERDALRTRLERLLRQNTVATLNGLPDDPVQNSCLVSVGDGWQGTADFVIDSPTIIDTPEAAKRKEWRLNFTGNCFLTLDVLAQSPRLASLTLTARLARSTDAMDYTVAKSATLTPDDGLTITGG